MRIGDLRLRVGDCVGWVERGEAHRRGRENIRMSSDDAGVPRIRSTHPTAWGEAVTKRDWLWTIGLVLVALATGTAYVFRFHLQEPIFDGCVRLGIDYPEWLLDPWMPIAPLAFAGVVAAFAFGLRRSATPSTRRLLPALGAVAAFAALVALPATIRWGWFIRESYDYPMMPDASSVRRTADPIEMDNDPDWVVGFSTPSEPSEVEQFYIEQFALREWSEAGSSAGAIEQYVTPEDDVDANSMRESIYFVAVDPVAFERGDSGSENSVEIEIAMIRRANGGTWVEMRKIDPSPPLFGSAF